MKRAFILFQQKIAVKLGFNIGVGNRIFREFFLNIAVADAVQCEVTEKAKNVG